MHSIHALHMEITAAICFWALLVVVLLVTATRKKRQSPNADD